VFIHTTDTIKHQLIGELHLDRVYFNYIFLLQKVSSFTIINLVTIKEKVLRTPKAAVYVQLDLIIFISLVACMMIVSRNCLRSICSAEKLYIGTFWLIL